MNRISVEEASARVLAEIAPCGTESVPLRSALGRILARDVRSPVTLPPWDNSSMDGYAVRAADVADATADDPAVLPVLETVAAGRRASQPLRAGTAIRIMTGAPVPEGADSVIRVEDTDGGVDRVAVRDARDAGHNVRPRGEDLREGDVAVEAGSRLGPGQIGVLASVGAGHVEVYRRPRVALIASGDELVDVDRFDEVRRGERIVSSNSYSLAAAITLAGGEVVELGVARDDPAALRERVERAKGCDMLVTSGGISVGAFDFTRDVLRDVGAEMKFWRVRMRPGAPVGFGIVHGRPWLGLPGNPVSVLVTFELFARPALRVMQGDRAPFRRVVSAIADEAISIAAPLTHFLRGVVAPAADGVLHARLTGPQGSGLLTSMARANALLVVAHDRPHVAPGESLPALLVADDAGSAAELRLA